MRHTFSIVRIDISLYSLYLFMVLWIVDGEILISPCNCELLFLLKLLDYLPLQFFTKW